MSERSYYDILGVSRDADEKALKSAFRRKAKEHHPDQHGGSEAAAAEFKAIAEAYEVLSDPSKRAIYDRVGKAGLNGSTGGARPEDVFRDAFGDFGEIFSEFFGGGGRPRGGPARGRDLRYDYEITLEDAYLGKQADITVPTTQRCEPCGGSGAEPGTAPDVCATCSGAGRLRVSQGFFTMERACVRCQGSGKVIKHPCRTCQGRGEVRAERMLSIRIPPGIEDGQRIRLAGEGDPGVMGGPKGDLYIFIGVREHAIFERDGQTLHAQATIPMTTAALGGEIELPTIDGGRTRISIPEGSLTGKRLRLRGKGMPSLRDLPIGDLVVELYVETPQNLSAKQKDLLRKFAAECGENSHPESRTFFDGVKKFFSRRSDSPEDEAA
jgi:molecular chaperone DnaJ